MFRPRGNPFAQPLPRRQLDEMEDKAAALPARSRCAHRLRDVSGQDLGARALRALHGVYGSLPCRWLAALVFRGRGWVFRDGVVRSEVSTAIVPEHTSGTLCVENREPNTLN